MPAPVTADDFLDLLTRSGLVEPEPLAAVLAAGAPRGPRQAADALVRDGLLTPFQANQLLQGKWRGFQLGKYRVLELLGAGGMGRVFLCQHTLMHRLVAIKVLPTASGKDSQLVERFYREARAVAALDHPNIVHAYDIDHDGRLHYLILEFVDGINLMKLVGSHGPLGVARACHYIAQAAAGLQHAHEAGWVHRDIKPGNLLVDRNGVVKVLDLGLARLFRDEGDPLSSNLDEKNVLGTADYLAPEQAMDSHNVDIRADVYSLGGTLYFLLTGSPPFGEGGVAQKLLWHQLRDPAPLHTRRADVPRALEAVVQRMMAKDRGQRYQTPAAVVEALGRWTEEPIGPPAEAELPRHCPLVGRLLPAGPPAGTSLAEAAAMASKTPLPRSRSVSPAAGLTLPRSPHGRRWALAAAGVGCVLAVAGAGWILLSERDPRPAPPLAKGPARPAPVAPPEARPGEGPLTPTEAARHVNERATVEFTVRHTGVSRNQKTFFLNSMADFNHPDNFTVVSHNLEAFAEKGIADPLSYYKGKTVRVAGTVTLYNGRPQIVVSDPGQIEVLAEGAGEEGSKSGRKGDRGS